MFGRRKKNLYSFEQPSRAAVEAYQATQDWGCVDCRTDTRCEYYHLRGEVWQAAGMGPKGLLCIGCLERRLGRRVSRADFTGVPINDPAYSRPPRPKSARLLDRLKR
ncbi:hypothetical protein ACGRHY_18915 [Streptomyces sp. HK10]|uniref:hypothetical protein n=1 Tax=Streptomyces sp. HK10 TaxID=3373255 RepID=UPI00374A3585